MLRIRILQTVRAQQSADREERILAQAERLFATLPFDRVTLAAVAQAAEVTIPTLQRRFGDKEGLFAACGQRMRTRVEGQRGACVAELVAHYELEGERIWHLLRQEDDLPLLERALDHGRRVH